ncbi:MAG: sugar ABC transporter substrate-binding protein [Lachnospiraceae bacterium]|nr:sugar ABC transporter substrate-binding protein [Lachnospiraceae bacterium]
MDKKTVKKINRRQVVVFVVLISAMIVMTFSSLIYVGKWADEAWEITDKSYEQFERHYILISDSDEDTFWEKVYEEARNYGEAEGVYLEWGGRELTMDYLKEELMKIAIASNVDGIILEGDGSEGVRELIDEAVDHGIPVVAVMTDSYDSKRQSFVGIGNHDLGREYGRQIIRIANKNTEDALILMDTSVEDSGQNLIYNGIKDTLDNEGNHLNLELKTLAFNEDSPFGEEEAIRKLFLNKDELPEIIVCLNEKNTISAYQAAIDYNLVGKVKILGYSDADIVLSAINRNVIEATIVVDAKQIGSSCMKALDEYIETGHVNDFFTMDVNVITSNNVEGYLKNAAEQDEE